MRVVIIGLGSIGRKHVQVLREIHPESEIFALRSNINSKSEKGVINIYSYDEIPDNIDFFIIANPTVYHKEVIKRVLVYNKPLFIEKPVLHELNNESIEIKREIKTNNIYTYTACPLRFHPCIEYLKKYLTSNKPRINEVSIYCGSFLPFWRPGKNFREVYSSRPELGGGVHLDLIHEIDYAYYIFGKPLKVDTFLTSQSSLGIPAVDYAHYYLEYPSFSATITLNYFRPNPKRCIEILFEKTVWNIDLIASTIKDEEGRILYSHPVNQKDLLQKQMSTFINNLNGGKPSPNNFEESIEVLKICLNQLH